MTFKPMGVDETNHFAPRVEQRLAADFGGTLLGRSVMNATTAAEIAAAAGLDQVENTSDDDKPVSLATSFALANKRDRVATKRTITGNYTLTAADGVADVVLHVTATADVTITLPTDTGAVIPQELPIAWRQYGAGRITFVAATGVTIVSAGGATASTARYSEGTLRKVASNTWLLGGSLSTTTTTPPVNTGPDVPGALATASAVPGNTIITVNWTPPTDDGGSAITGYRVTRTNPAWEVIDPATARSRQLTNFTNGTPYTVTVAAVNAIGVGPASSFTVTPTAGGTGPVTGTGFKATILNIASNTHYYPMNDTYALTDLAGDRPLSNTGGGVTFTANGAVFDGSTADYLTAETSPDFSVRNTTNQIAFFVAVKFPTYSQPSQFHWMGKGGNLADNYEWALRLYGDGDAARARNISNYYWNPNPSFDINGNSVPSRRGSGAYLAPPSASPDFGGTERHNGPVHSGDVAVEHLLGFEFTYGANYSGRCRLYYGDSFNPMALLSDRAMNADALVTPVYGNGRLYIGKRGDSDGMVKATIRRLAFFNTTLSLTTWQSIRTSHLANLTNEG